MPPSLDEFVRDATTFLDNHLEPKPARAAFEWGRGDDEVALFEEQDAKSEAVNLAAARSWLTTRFDAGYGWITGPVEHGGGGLTPAHAKAYASLEGRYDAPPLGYFGVGLGMVAPTVLAHARPEIAQRYLRPLWRGDLIACQLFSEPGAGSDLASITTKAERDGDDWIITGQKVWTSGAHYSDVGEVICRTDPSLPKHHGLTAFLVDMHAPGVQVRPLRQMTGGASFNEVFLDEVRVRDDHRLGDVNGGWTVALTTLMNERASIGAGGVNNRVGGIANGERLFEMVRHFALGDDLVVRDELLKVYVGFQVAKWNNRRWLAEAATAGPGPKLSAAKLALTSNMQAVAELVGRVLGPHLVADSGAWGTYAWTRFTLGVPGVRIAGGTDEVIRNILAERVLGLPKDPADRGART